MMSLASNPIWFREQQTWRARARRLPFWRRSRYLALPAVWIAILLGCCLIQLVSRSNMTASAWREVLEITLVASCYVQLGYLVFRGVIAGATGVVRERELQTMDTLLSSPLPPAELVRGKWMVAALPLLCEVLATFPLAMAMLGLIQVANPDYDRGPAWWAVGDCFLLSAGLIVFMTGLGLWISTRASNSGRATTQAVLYGLGVALGTYMVDLLVEVFTRADDFHAVASCLNPWTALWSIWENDKTFGTSSSTIGPHMWLGTLTAYVCLGCALAFLAWQRMRRPAQS
ncbi:MAG TPA: ABC transporter permease subunit [Candidatus Xenobia bacterium]|jgi:ABC-type transport system involved in multi-copper enzyme maturation permease subunit